MKISRNIAITMICILLGLILSWQYQSIYNHKKVAAYDNKTIEELKSELLEEKNKYDNLYQKKEDLEKELRNFENARGDLTQTTETLKKSLDQARLIAGLTDVKGKGVIITLEDDNPGFVREENILEVLNEVKAADAQAISVNGERIVAMSEVREAGGAFGSPNGYIMINGKQMKAPFEIKVIADPENMEHTLKMIGGVKQVLENDWLIKVNIEKSDNITIPKVRDDGSVIKTDLLIPVK